MDDLLTSDHRELDEILGQLFSAIDTGDAVKVFEKLDIFWARLAMHIRAEHLHLFPALLKAAKSQDMDGFSVLQASIDDLRGDHDFFVRELGKAVKILRELLFFKQDTEEKLPQVLEMVNAVVDRLNIHNAVEESKIYPLMQKFFNDPDFAELNELFHKELNKLPPRFAGDRLGGVNLDLKTLLLECP